MRRRAEGSISRGKHGDAMSKQLVRTARLSSDSEVGILRSVKRMTLQNAGVAGRRRYAGDSRSVASAAVWFTALLDAAHARRWAV